jgi:choline-sulfatase
MPSHDTNRPNVLFILSDDQGPWAMHCAGMRELRTPNLDRLAQTGLRFDNFFCTSPVCSPARASLLTGRIPSQHGIHDWLSAGNTTQKLEPSGHGELVEYLQGQPGYTDYLARAGYVCGISGKWHVGDSHHPQKGFTFWRTHAKGGGSYYNATLIRDGQLREEPRYVTDVITDNALDFLNQQQTDARPFYLSVHYTAPHAPWGRQNHPAELFDDYHQNCDFESVPRGLQPPPWVLYSNIPVEDEDKRRIYLSGYAAAITAMDTNIGRLIDWLEAHQLRENTLIVFMSDNGMNMGHHGVFGKGNATYPLNMFEESVKVPFIVSCPGRVPSNSLCHELLSQYDFMPTLLEYLSVPGGKADLLPGRSFASAWRGQPAAGHEHLVVFDEYGPVRMVRTRDWKYVHRYAGRFPNEPHELYDLKNDPGETTNLIHDASGRTPAADMKARLDEWFGRYANPEFDGSREAVTGSGQMGPIGAMRRNPQAFEEGRIAHLVKGK